MLTSRNHLFTQLFFYFLVVPIGHGQDARTDFNAKYVITRGFAQKFAFSGSQKPKYKLWVLFSPQNLHFGARFRRDLSEKGSNTGYAHLQRTLYQLIVIVAIQKFYSEQANCGRRFQM